MILSYIYIPQIDAAKTWSETVHHCTTVKTVWRELLQILSELDVVRYIDGLKRKIEIFLSIWSSGTAVYKPDHSLHNCIAELNKWHVEHLWSAKIAYALTWISVPCKPGTYRSSVFQRGCRECILDKISGYGWTKCQNCPSGEEANDGHTECGEYAEWFDLERAWILSGIFLTVSEFLSSIDTTLVRTKIFIDEILFSCSTLNW